MSKDKLTSSQVKELIGILRARFEKNMSRHRDIKWEDVENRLHKSPDKLMTLHRLEATGGEPDVVSRDKGGACMFLDCSAESPKERRSYCYDEAALKARKENKPRDSAMAAEAPTSRTRRGISSGD